MLKKPSCLFFSRNAVLISFGINMFVILLLTSASFGLSEDLTVRVKHGPVRGNVLQVGEHAVYAFRNIPHAKPPIGDLRFQLPEEHDGWFSEDDLYQNVTIRCPQNAIYGDDIVPGVVLGQEDCLVLDVYVRKVHKTGNSSLPVLVYFHGGKFNSGSKEDHGPDFLLRYNDIILVVPNYRLGILGFLSFQDSVLPGNLGLWDQNAAMRWVFTNIEKFGGDPRRITIAGHEAGATSVGLHILAPTSHEYFQGALSGSGTAFSSWLVDVSPSSSTAYRIAGALRCRTMPKNEILRCLKSAALEDIVKIQGQIKKLSFLPTIDSAAENPFIPFSPKNLYAKNYQKDVNYLIGFAEHEASYEVSREFPNVLKYQHLDKMIQHFLKPHFKNALNFEMIAIAAKYHYLRGIMIPTFESIEPVIAKMMTDFLYKSPLEQVLRLQGKKTENIFVYVFKSERQYSCGLENRRCFGNEFFVFNTTSHQKLLDLHSNVEKVIETVSKIWGDFVSFGYPEVHGKWRPFNDIYELHYAEISDIIQPRTKYANDDSEFWISLVSDLNAASNASEEYLNEPYISEFSTIDTWGATGLAILCGVLCIALIGLVVITKRRILTMSMVTVSSPKEFKLINS